MFAKKFALLLSFPALLVSPLHAARIKVGNIESYKVRRQDLSSDTKNLSQDWCSVGKDIKKSMETYEQQIG